MIACWLLINIAHFKLCTCLLFFTFYISIFLYFVICAQFWSVSSNFEFSNSTSTSIELSLTIPFSFLSLFTLLHLFIIFCNSLFLQNLLYVFSLHLNLLPLYFSSSPFIFFLKKKHEFLFSVISFCMVFL